MRYSVEPKYRIYVRRKGFLSFAKCMGKNLSDKCSQKLLDSAAKSTTYAIKTASNRAIQKTTEATGDLTSNKISDEIRSVLKKSSAELCSKNDDANSEIEETKKNTYLQKKGNIIDELRLV